jgi:hypothetical protein
MKFMGIRQKSTGNGVSISQPVKSIFVVKETNKGDNNEIKSLSYPTRTLVNFSVLRNRT